MIMKEKFIFWFLLLVLIAAFITGILSQEKKKAQAEAFIREIEAATEKAKVKKKSQKYDWDIDSIKTSQTIDNYASFIKKDVFFRKAVEALVKPNKDEIIPLKVEEPKKPMFVYKGRIMMGSQVMVIIEDQGTGKSYSVKEGDRVGNFSVLSIDDKEVRLKNKEGKEIILATVKKEKEGKKEEGAEASNQ